MASVSKRTWTHASEEKTAWVVRYKDGGGIRRMQTFPSKKLADKARLRIEVEIEHGEHTAARDTETIGATAEAYIRHQEDRLRGGTLRRTTCASDKSAITSCIMPALGGVKWTDLTIARIATWHDAMIRERGITAGSALVRVKILRSMERFARLRGATRKGIVHEAIASLPRAQNQKVRTFTVEEVKHLLTVASGPKPEGTKGHFRAHAMYEVVVHIAAYCGLRMGEIFALSPRDIDFDRRRLFVRKSVNRFGEVGEPKTAAGVRPVPMPAVVAALIRQWIEQHFVANEHDLIFTVRSGLPVNGSNFFRLGWQPLLKRAGLEGDGDSLHFHALRHFTASWMLENGIPPATVSRLIGHSSVAMTLRVYTHSVREMDQWQGEFDRVSSLVSSDIIEISATRAPQIAQVIEI
ncbi:site-specific integrase [Methylorubrum extorquens]|uniref:tyrosine-type recombinase/integrase n=1 Tax=Methylorubrum extorquens TaxID=408 RepID=UPI002238F94F|nr:site-specific integrase [Methylorubrum extorquens]UYW25671.1 site-specific integrase [Methylorubrum extorquens]